MAHDPDSEKVTEPDLLIKSLGDKVRTIRREKNLTQQELGNLSDLSYKYVGEIERAEKNPSIKVLSRIANALNVDLIELISFDLPSSLWEGADQAARKKLLDRINRLLREQGVSELEKANKILKVVLEK
ncbi:MAG: helix-turn-helix domain-containing protein [Proteobacteria bacterium]|jgi:transcriptional regulator with XRE-family HTH domain|nr:helix-turn-helix domain-containing protein [Pseudomonadota bacterium]